MEYPNGLGVCNEAISVIGSNKLMTVVDTEAKDPTVRNLAMLYESARKLVLLEHPWNFARVVEPAGASRCSDHRWLFPMPGNCLRLMGVYDRSGESVAHSRVGDLVYCEEEPHELHYVRDDDEPDVWDPWVRRALVHRLAADFARPLTGSMQERDLQEQAYANALQKAKTVNSQEDAGQRRRDYAQRVIYGEYE